MQILYPFLKGPERSVTILLIELQPIVQFLKVLSKASSFLQAGFIMLLIILLQGDQMSSLSCVEGTMKHTLKSRNISTNGGAGCGGRV